MLTIRKQNFDFSDCSKPKNGMVARFILAALDMRMMISKKKFGTANNLYPEIKGFDRNDRI
jgi:hypothetical protein